MKKNDPAFKSWRKKAAAWEKAHADREAMRTASAQTRRNPGRHGSRPYYGKIRKNLRG
tara:strand:+ start:657 stop:830 length:174 start_codon:yes stop_codon:yes gene_type:complete